MMSIKINRFIISLFSILVVSGCTTTDGDKNRAGTGAIVGAIAGAVIGNQAGGDRKDRILGAAIGAAAGAGVGYTMDQQEKEFKAALEEEQRNNEIEVQRVREDLLKLTLSSEVSFDTNSAELKPAFYGTMKKLATVLTKYSDSNVMVVGHTDSTGSEAYNQALSERRAKSVSNYLDSQGVSSHRLSTSGEGENNPRADNNTASGRTQNRRVEIFVQRNQ